ncbi:MAG: serine hydrolase domain-containing protein [Bacteroidota bacterium]
MNKSLIFFSLLFLLLTACQPEISPEPLDLGTCNQNYDGLSQHPKADIYQEIVDRNAARGIVGTTIFIKDAEGIWAGSHGMADLAAQRAMRACDRQMIASISKPFTSAVTYRLIEEGILGIDDPIKDYLPEEVVKKLANVDVATVKECLSHRSGIPDYYNLGFLVDQINVYDNVHSYEDLLRYTYGKKADFPAGTSYAYSNNNFVILGMIAEAVSGQTLATLYQNYIFDPMGLEQALYDLENPLPDDIGKGYADLYGDGNVVLSEFLYRDETRTPDGGIVIDNYDLYRFFSGLVKGELLQESSLDQMLELFDLPEDWQDTEILGQVKNGYGIEHFEHHGTYGYGHTGGVDGFLSMAYYYPEEDFMFIQVINTASFDYEPRIDMFNELAEIMFAD